MNSSPSFPQAATSLPWQGPISYEGDATRGSIQLPTGRLDVVVHRSDFRLDQLCGFAARQNPKRGFLFVSKILGKHIPARPSTMRDSYRRLAAKVAALELPGPIVVTGMAETAICLGQGVYEELVRATGRNDIVFIHTTRYDLGIEPAVAFREEHCHAADHILYYPVDAYARSLFVNARSLVLVDDEASTGSTFVNLASALVKVCPKLRAVTTVMITDWRGPQRTEVTHRGITAGTGAFAHTVALLEGQYDFTPAADLQFVQMPKAVGNGEMKDDFASIRYGRAGLVGFAPQMYEGSLDPRGRKLLVLGTGEFAFPPFALAEQLEAAGYDVYVQSTTRSPVMVGGAMGSAMQFTDNYGDGINNYLYNAQGQQYDGVVLCTETPAETLDHERLVEPLRAMVVEAAR